MFDNGLSVAKSQQKLHRVRGQIIGRHKKVYKLTLKIAKLVSLEADQDYVQLLLNRLDRMENDFPCLMPGYFGRLLSQAAVNFRFIIAPGEADLEIGRLCQRDAFIVVTKDSDHLYGYPSIETIIRPVKGRQVQIYRKSAVVRGLGFMSNTALCVLGVLSGCDYSTRIRGYGIKRLWKVLLEADHNVASLELLNTLMTELNATQEQKEQFRTALDIFMNCTEIIIPNGSAWLIQNADIVYDPPRPQPTVVKMPQLFPFLSPNRVAEVRLSTRDPIDASNSFKDPDEHQTKGTKAIIQAKREMTINLVVPPHQRKSRQSQGSKSRESTSQIQTANQSHHHRQPTTRPIPLDRCY